MSYKEDIINFLNMLVNKKICDYKNNEYIFPCTHIPNYEKLKTYFSANLLVGFCHNCSQKVTLKELMEFIFERYNIDYKQYGINLSEKYSLKNKWKENEQIDGVISVPDHIIIYDKAIEEYIEPDLSIKLANYQILERFPKFIKIFLENRKINIDIAKEYGLKYVRNGIATGVLIPVESVYGGNIVEAQIRIINNEAINMPKVMCITGSKKMSFFGINQFIPVDNTLLLTESWGNVLSYVSQTGERNIIASMGSGLTKNQVRNLKYIKTKYNIKHIILVSDLKMVEKNYLKNVLKIDVSVFNINNALDELKYNYNINDDIDINDIIKKYNKIDIKDIIYKYIENEIEEIMFETL